MMKAIQRNLILILCIVIAPLQGQRMLQVAPGEGTLEAALAAAQPGDEFQLIPGGIYSLSGEASAFGTIRFPVTIGVEPGTGEKAILQLGPRPAPIKYFFIISDGAALTLRGLEIHGLLDDTLAVSSMMVFDARPDPSQGRIGNFRFEDCLFHDFIDNIVHGMKDDWARGLIQDSVFIHKVTVYNAKHFLQYKHVSLRHLEMTNTTVFRMQGMALKIGKIGYRCVLENPNKPYIPITDETITPTGFIDHCTLDDLGDIHGHIQVDDAFHLLNITNCIISHQQQFDQPPVFFTDPRTALCVSIRNTCFWEVGPPNTDVGGTQWIGYEFLDTTFADPEFLDQAAGNFSLPDRSELLTAATDGGQVGDLRWGTYPTTGVEGSKESPVMQSVLLQNFPNPFQGSTTFTYRVEAHEFVSIRLYTVTGEEIALLVNEVKAPGTHTVTWDARHTGKGLYICRMQSGTRSAFRKIIRQ